MKLLYVNEHINCSKYASDEDALIRIVQKKSPSENWEGHIPYSLLVYVVSGSIVVSWENHQKRKAVAGEMLFLPNNSFVSESGDDCFVTLIFRVDMDLNMCNRFNLENLLKQTDITKDMYDFPVLKANDRLSRFFSLLLDCLSDGLRCIHFMLAKRNELLLLLRAYYTKEELALLFYPILSTNLDVKNFVMSNYYKVKDTKELASLANMSMVTFNRHFKKVFGESAARWFEKQKAESILREIEQTNKTFQEISDQYDFSSPSYLVTFCKRHFKKTPKEIRDNFFDRMSRN